MAEEAKSTAGESNSAAKSTDLPDDGKSEAALTDAAEKPAVSETAQRDEVANPAAGNAHTANKPDTDPTGPERKPIAKAAGDKPSPEERKAKAAAAKAAKEQAADGDAKPAAKAKKEKPPALEDKPFAEFINQHFLPTLKDNLTQQGIQDLDLKFEKQKLPISGLDENPECWQVIGRWQSGKRQFNIGFLKEDIQGSKVFTYADNGGKPSTLESFMIDERKVNLDLLVLYTAQRLNGQKWLVGN
jgi:hypothetical protein